ncbi:MAG: hypothetical protein AAFV95_12750 [Bacteroidota bacterium]
MNDKALMLQTSELIARDFGIELGDAPLGEQELLDLLADQLAYMIEYRLEFLMSLMYRLDVKEHQIQQALSPGAELPPNVGLAHLVMERQKQRIFTKRHYKQSKLDDLEEGLEF